MNLRKLLRRYFQKLFKSKAKQQRHAFQEWQRTRPPSLPDVPTIDLAKTPITPITPIPSVPGEWLAQDRAKKGLRTIRLEPLQHTDSFPWLPDESWINSKLMPVYEPPEVETEHMPAFVKALHERKRNDA
jgi:hypothetical protein